MRKGKAKKDILYISISSFVLVFIWIGFSIYHAYVDSTIEPSILNQIEPINSSFDTSIINELKNRQDIIPVYELENTNNTTPDASPTPQTTNTPVSTASGIPTESGGFIDIEGA